MKDLVINWEVQSGVLNIEKKIYSTVQKSWNDAKKCCKEKIT